MEKLKSGDRPIGGSILANPYLKSKFPNFYYVAIEIIKLIT